jgi:hypothetical protein
MHQRDAADLETLFEVTNPADLTRNLTVIQTLLIALAAAKTDVFTSNVSRAEIREARDQLS